MAPGTESPEEPTKCPACGVGVSPDAKFCGVCGATLTKTTPSVPTPPVPQASTPRKKRRRPLILVFSAVVLLSACLVCGVVAGFSFLGGSFRAQTQLDTLDRTDLGVPRLVWDENAQRKAVEAAAANLEGALRSGDVDGAAKLVRPDLQESYKAVFASNKDKLRDLATLLATRKLTTITPERAEFELADSGKKLYISFSFIDGKWYITSF